MIKMGVRGGQQLASTEFIILFFRDHLLFLLLYTMVSGVVQWGREIAQRTSEGQTEIAPAPGAPRQKDLPFVQII